MGPAVCLSQPQSTARARIRSSLTGSDWPAWRHRGDGGYFQRVSVSAGTGADGTVSARLPHASVWYPCGIPGPIRATANRTTRAFPGPDADAVIRAVSKSADGWLAEGRAGLPCD